MVNGLWPDVVVTLHMKLCKSQVSKTVFLTPVNSKSLWLAGNRAFLKDIYFSISRLVRRLFPSLRQGLTIYSGWPRTHSVDQPEWPGTHPDPPPSASQRSVTQWWRLCITMPSFFPKLIRVKLPVTALSVPLLTVHVYAELWTPAPQITTLSQASL